MRVAVVGAGAWGTSLANLLCLNGHPVTLWAHDAENLNNIKRSGKNQRYLPGIALCPELHYDANINKAIEGAECVVIAVPSKYLREVTGKLSKFKGIAVSVTKGIEYETGLTMSGLMRETMPAAAAAALSGPTLAMEVAKNIPAAIVAAHPDIEIAKKVQVLFSTPTFRVYTTNDVLGVELGGALKNVVAIAAGIGDGLGFGDNAKAALVTRAIVEIRRLGVACGAQSETFAGLSGLGDLTVTCFSKLSRNRGFGERVGRGEKVADILGSTITVAEGYPTARSAYQLARKVNVETPIIDEVHEMLYRGKDIRKAVHDLMTRELKREH
jgi:glycerol-3-phosphate dehydrogenase (NAD(P)+)